MKSTRIVIALNCIALVWLAFQITGMCRNDQGFPRPIAPQAAPVAK